MRIVVINPNSNVAVTRDIDAALDGLRLPGRPIIDCGTLDEGPQGIEAQRDVDGVVLPLCRLIAREEAGTDAFVIAYFSDPGLHAAREVTRRPVIGIAAAGLTTALNLGERVGVMSIQQRSLARHARYVRALGLEQRVAGDLPLNLRVEELADEGTVADPWSRSGHGSGTRWVRTCCCSAVPAWPGIARG
jgi:Asp/Glu/hydantoin racemase